MNDTDAKPRNVTSSLINDSDIPSYSFVDGLTNTLLITGVPGCGKTAAVYACAEELGWEIFEVYPGIGKRNGANLERLVGDVSRNHTIDRGLFQKGKHATRTLLSALARREGPMEAEPPAPEPCDEVEATKCASRKDPQALPDGQDNNIRQSLILLEEVDILFKDDVGFWPSLIDFIKDCRRPVILTCNGSCSFGFQLFFSSS